MIQELGNDLIPVLAISLTFLFLVIWIVAATIDSIYKTRCTVYLKEKLIDRGASPAEIHQVIMAGTESEDMAYTTPVPPVKSAAMTPAG